MTAPGFVSKDFKCESLEDLNHQMNREVRLEFIRPQRIVELTPICDLFMPSENICYHIQKPWLSHASCPFSSGDDCDSFKLAQELIYRTSLGSFYDLFWAGIAPGSPAIVWMKYFADFRTPSPITIYVDKEECCVWVHYNRVKNRMCY